MKNIIGKVIAQYITCIDNDFGTCREICVLEGGNLHIRVNCSDGVERRYNIPVSQFETEYKINILDTPIAKDLKPFNNF
jgi:hypothetical protein